MEASAITTETQKANLFRYLTLRQTATYLGMSPTTLYRLTYRMADRLPFYKVGKLKLFRIEDVDQWMERHRVQDRPQGW